MTNQHSFQEIVPLNAGNVLVIEDNEPASKWLSLINQALNKPSLVDKANGSSILTDYRDFYGPQTLATLMSIDIRNTSSNGIFFFQKPSLKTFGNNFRTEQGRCLRSCNCPEDENYTCFRVPYSMIDEYSSEDDEDDSNDFMDSDIVATSNSSYMGYSLVASKKMVGIFVTIWVKKQLVQHIGHVRLSSVGRGIMGYLGNKGCISVSMSLHETSFCFVCSHLTSGEKEGDELRRNADVTEILKNTQFPNICKSSSRRIPERILEHDRVIWLGDLNYRIALSYSETRKLMEDNDWDTLLKKDQLRNEKEAGRIFKDWTEGNIDFAPTYKYSDNSDDYAGESTTSKKKRRTPAWCDRILWHGSGIKQLSYIRGESRFSDHRPVCATFLVDVSKSKKNSNMKIGVEELLPPAVVIKTKN